MESHFLGIDHVGIVVKDLEEATATYRDILGFKISGDEVLEDRGLHVSFVETGNSKLELIAPTREDSEVSRFLEKRGEGIHHICIEVRDIEETRFHNYRGPVGGEGVGELWHNFP